MQRIKRAAATKAVTYTDTALTDDEDEDRLELDHAAAAGDSGSVASSSRHSRSKVDDEEDEWSEGDDSDGAPAAKKARTSTRSSTAKSKGKGKGRAGKLSAFLAMPLDVLVEISRHLDPPTLLAMSRANKMMRNVFACRSAAPIWAIVRSNVYLPELESTDLSEMQLASLIFERNCHLCGRGRAVIVDYALRRRWCKACQRANLNNVSRTRNAIDDLHPKALQCSLFTHHSASGCNWAKKPYYCLTDVQAISDRLYELDEDIQAAQRDMAKVKPLHKRGKHVKGDELDDAEGAYDRAVAGLEAFVAQRQDIIAASQKDAAALVTWERSSLVSRKEAGEVARKARKAAIKAKLLTLGYDEADCNSLHWSSVANLIDQPTQLTDAIWARISPKIFTHLEAEKQRRLARERERQLRARYNALKPRYEALLSTQHGLAHTTFPSYSVFSTLPSVEPLWVPEGAAPTEDEWGAALPAILKEVDTARRVIKVGYARRFVNAVAEVEALVDAALVGKLEEPGEPVRPTGILLHSAAVADETAYASYEYFGKTIDLGDTADTATDDELGGLLNQLVARFACGGGFYNKGLEHYPEAHGRLRDSHCTGLAEFSTSPSLVLIRQELDILERAGLPNDRSSMAKLEGLGPVFECYGCDVNPRLRPFYPQTLVAAVFKSKALLWSEAVSHALKQHWRQYLSNWAEEPGSRVEIRLTTVTYPATPTPPPEAADAERDVAGLDSDVGSHQVSRAVQ